MGYRILFILLFLVNTVNAQMLCNGWRFSSAPELPTTNIYAYFESDNGVTESGGNVSQWNDLSGNGHHAVQATGGKQPNISGDEITFSVSSDDVLTLTSTASVAVPVEVYLVVKPNTSSGFNVHVGDNALNYVGYVTSGGTVSTEAAFTVSTSSVSNGTYYLLHHTFNGGSSLAQINDNAAGTGSIFTTTNFSTITIGSGFNSLFGGGSVTIKAAYFYQGGAADDAGVKAYTTYKYGTP
jgi:hypothetical protein